jgi:hypothetical protein
VLPDKTHAVFHGLKGVAKSRFKFQAIAICAALMTFATTGWGQTTISSDGLNNATTVFTLSGGAYYTGTTSSTLDSPTSAPYAVEGTHSRGISSGTATLTSGNINTSGYSSVQMQFRLASYSIGSTGNGADGADIVTVEVSPDGGTTYYSTVRVLGNTNARWSWTSGTGNASTAYDGNASPADFTSGAGTVTTTGYSTVTITSLPATSNLKIRITMLNDNSAERWLVDDFKIIGTLAGTPTLTAVTLSSALSTTAGTASTGVSFTAAGANLNTDITVTPQTGYEVSTTSASAGFGPSAINVAKSTTVWVRFAASMALGTYNSATAVVLTGGGASSSANVTTSGSGNNVSPANDLSSAPTSVTVNGSAANGTTAAATYSTITSDANSKTDVWFSLTAPEDGTVTLTTTSTSQDLDIEAWAGPAAPTSTTGQLIGDGAGTGNTSEVATFTAVAGTTYFVRVLQFSGTAGSFTIAASMPLSPSTPASNFTSSNIMSASATIGWTRGNGTTGVLVVARASGAVNTDPTNGTTYTANAAFGSGTQIGTGNYVVYKGAGTSVGVTGLSPSTAYYFAVYEYNATGLMHNMAELTGNLTTSSGVVAPSVTTSAATAIGSTTATLNGNPTADNGNAITSRGFVYSTTDATPTIGEAGVTLVILSGTTGAMSTALASLGANTVYYFNAYAINGIGTSYGTVQSFTTSQLSAPITSAGDSITSSGFNANWSAVTGATGYQLDVYVFAAPTTTDLIISEYVEGSSNNKYVEIYNGTGSTVTLSNYELRLHNNGATIGSNTQNLGALTSGPATLAHGQTLVLKNSSATLALPAGVTAYASATMGFNGDDALALYKISTSSYVDIFGVLGSDPGTDWGTGATSCIDKTQRRKLTVTGGVTVNPVTFTTLGTEWDSYAIDTVSDLGSHKSTTYLLQNQSVGNITTYAVTGASAATQYSYVVRATSANSTSANSDVRTVTTKGTSSIAVNSGTTSLTYSGAAQGPTFTVTGSTGAVTYSYTGTGGTAYGTSATAPTNVGSYSATATAAADTDFEGVVSSATAFTIAKATPSITALPTASAISFGQTLASSVLSSGTASVDGSFSFTTTSTAPSAGTVNQPVTFTPTDTANYNTASTTASVTVNKADATVTWPTAATITYGEALSAATLTGGSGDGTFAFTSPSTVPSAGAAQSYQVTFTPASGNYKTATQTVSVTVNKATPTISFVPSASAISFGQTLASSVLSNGTASVDGSFSFTTTSTAPSAGTVNQPVTFTPTDTANYNTTSTTVSVRVNPVSLNSSDITLTPAEDGSYAATATGGASFTYSYVGRNQTSYGPSATAPTAAGFYSVTATATGNYSGSNSADFSITGPMAIADSLTKPADNEPYMIPVSELLTNDFRITSTSGATVTTGLSVSAVTGGAGNTASYNVGDRFIQFTPSSGASDTFTYTVTDGVSTATATVTITTETQAPTFTLQIVKVGTASFAGGNTTVTHDFIGVPNQTYLVEYTTNLENGPWTSAGNQSTGTTGSFSVTFTKSGDVAADWNAHMFFRARLVP